LATVDLGVPVLAGTEALAKARPAQPVDDAVTAIEQALEPAPSKEQPVPADVAQSPGPAAEVEAPELSLREHEERERSMGYAETIAATQAPVSSPEPSVLPETSSDADIRTVLENSVREIAGEVRNSLDFHRTQDQGGEISHVSLSGAVLDLPGFADALQSSLGVEVRREVVGLVDASLEGKVSTHRLAVAAGLAATEAPR
jgi:type IV pilus assembly protein PilM